ncbi:reverse transcriptase domain-containing protein [Tanacetum coccineum]
MTRSPRRHRRSHSPRQSSNVFTRLKRERSRSSRHDQKNKARRESNVFERHGIRGRSVSAYFDSRQENSRYTEKHSESEDSGGGHWKSKSQKQKPSIEDDDLSKPWVCADTDPFMSQICHFNFPKTRMPIHIKTYDGSGDPKDHLKIFQAATKTERWAMPTWCHMFNSTLTMNARVWFDDLPPESIDSYDDLRETFLKNYLQQKKCIRDPIVLHKIKQRDGESTEDFTKIQVGERIRQSRRNDASSYVLPSRVGGCFKSRKEEKPSRHGNTKKEVTGKISKKEEASASNVSKKRGRIDSHSLQKRDILALEKGKFKTSPPMTTPVEKRNANKFYEFHGEVGHNTDE